MVKWTPIQALVWWMGDIIGIRPEAESIQAYYSSDQSISLYLKVKILTLHHVITIYKDNELHEELIDFKVIYVGDKKL